ncbi:microfibrillar-associated protein 2 isoform X2 [Brienomyrus brachyistius]|uniref:microfibrillar-associated protein 2 isoform X2 n=1 Tax=Brienomyrus brachyistius TaxID=42636 RepID=UPI0020B265DA|nr:microfibrillar-associated protein 2 isoform X2 [Brienomyrus brachyistius]
MWTSCLLLFMPGLLFAQQQESVEDFYTGQYFPLDDYDYGTAFPVDPNAPPRHVLPSPQQQQQQQVLQQISGPSQSDAQTEPTEPGPLDCREEQYPCTRLYSVHKPCRECLQSLCFYSLRRVYVVNKEVCVRTVCAHEELLRADLCRDQFPRCGVAALTGQCGALGSSCGKSCGGC